MKNWLIKALFLCLLIQTSCAYKTQYEGVYIDGNAASLKLPSQNHQIIYITDGKLYAIDPTLKDSRSYPKLPAGIVFASISPAHNKIAYKTANANSTIIDSTGMELGQIANTAGIRAFDFHANNETVYYVEGLTLKFSGPPVQAAITDFATVFPTGSTNKTIFGAIIRADGAVIYVSEYYFGGGSVREVTFDNVSGVDIKNKVYEKDRPVSWMRGSETGKTVYFGGQNSMSSVSFAMDFYDGAREQYLSGYFAAYFPDDGVFSAYSSYYDLKVVGNNHEYSKRVTTQTQTGITCLDW